ncbi:MAG: HIT domain-containing protein [Halothiobacillaceae bacterium]
MHDAHYPWLILIPQRSGLRELHELSEDDQFQLMRESSHVARFMTQLFHPEKLNIAALGNLVPQLHIHHIARYSDDPAWPHPVWGAYQGQTLRPPSACRARHGATRGTRRRILRMASILMLSCFSY